jgi:hypothetical protein
MLDSEDNESIARIKKIANIVWGDMCYVGNIKVFNVPFGMFEMPLTIYMRHEVMISYDRSIIDISIKKNGEYKWLTDLTDEKVIEGFESSKEENLLHNFEVLDKVLQTM